MTSPSPNPQIRETLGEEQTVSKRNLFERLMGLLVEPDATFAVIIARPDLVGPILLIILTIAFSITGLQLTVAHLPAEVAEKVSAIPMIIFQAVAGLVVIFINLLIRALVFYWLGLFTGGGASYKQALSVAGYLNFTGCLQAFFTVVVLLLTGQNINLGLGFFLSYEELTTLRGMILSNLNIFIFGYLMLSTVGLSRLLKISRTKAAVVTVSLWLTVLTLGIGIASIGIKFGGRPF